MFFIFHKIKNAKEFKLMIKIKLNFQNSAKSKRACFLRFTRSSFYFF